MILLAALLLDALIGDPPALWRLIPHPVALIGAVVEALERKLNRTHRSGADRRIRGALVAVALVAASVGLGLVVTELRRRWSGGWVVELLLAWSLLAQRSLFDHVRAVGRALRKHGLGAGRQAVARIVGRDPDSLDAFGVARAAIESCAESFADGVVAPVFWYGLFGMPGLLAMKTVNTMDSMIGHPEEPLRNFGMVAARLDDAMNFIPARLSGLLLAIAALFVPGGRPFAALGVMWRHHGRHASPNSGWPEAAMAGGLGLALAGPRRYGGEMVAGPWIGDGRARATPADIAASLYMLSTACLLTWGLIVLLVVAQS
jgi:adenosylcobinamide-phosphate synthase